VNRTGVGESRQDRFSGMPYLQSSVSGLPNAIQSGIVSIRVCEWNGVESPNNSEFGAALPVRKPWETAEMSRTNSFTVIMITPTRRGRAGG